MGIFDIKNTDIFSKDYDSANAWLEYNIFITFLMNVQRTKTESHLMNLMKIIFGII